MRTPSPSFLGLLLACGVSIGLGAWWLKSPPESAASRPQAATASDAEPGVLRIGVEGELLPINPLETASSYSAQLCGWIFDGLMTFDTSGNTAPNLAHRYEVSEDGCTYTFWLRPGVRFHDGQPLTAGDVVFSYEVYRNLPAGNTRRQDTEYLSQVDRVADGAVQCRLARPNAEFLSHCATYEILPSHCLRTAEDRARFGRQPVGSGPFRFLEWRPDGGVELAAYGQYHLGPPRLQRIVVKPAPNVATAWTRFLAGETDMLSWTGLDASQLTRDRGMRVVKIPGQIVYSLIFNPRHPVVADVRVRRALCAMLDRNLLATQVSLPCVPSPSIFPEEWRSAPTEGQEGVSATEAEALMQAAGWHRNPAGDFERDGQVLSLPVLVCSDTAERGEVALALRQQFTASGVRTEIRYRAEDAEGDGGDARLGALLSGSVLGVSPCVTSRSWRQESGPGAKAWFLPSQLAALFSELAVTEKHAAQIELCARIEALIAEQALLVPLVVPINCEYTSPRFQGDLQAFFRSRCSAAAVLGWHVE